MLFNRETFIAEIEKHEPWDVIVIGGGASGLGTAVDAASRGYRTLLLEQSDFAKGTSSRSTKLVHGGVRYLAQGNISLVYEALHERDLLLQNAAHLVKRQQFVIPVYSWFSKYKYLVGLKLYDLLAGKNGFEKSHFLSVAAVLEAIPGLNPTGLTGGISYSDGQFDDARLALNLAQTAAEQGGVLLNYMKVTSLLKEEGRLTGLRVLDLEKDHTYEVYGRTIVNATGIFVDEVLKMDLPLAEDLVRPSQGAHLVLDASFLKGDSALMIPKTSDGRVLFAVPWHGKVLVGTTDTPLDAHSLDPVPLEKEVEFILDTAGKYLSRAPVRSDVKSAFAGLRPLAAAGKEKGNTKEISRSHKVVVSKSGLITIVGGKWTTYRKMAMDILDKAIAIGQLPAKACVTMGLKVHGYLPEIQPGDLSIYGSDAAGILQLIALNPEWNTRLHPDYHYVKAEVIWMIRNEMARTIDDILSRRMRLLFLDVRAALKLAPFVAELMAAEMNKDQHWMDTQLIDFEHLAKSYLLE